MRRKLSFYGRLSPKEEGLTALLGSRAVGEIADEKLAAYATELEISNEGYTD